MGLGYTVYPCIGKVLIPVQKVGMVKRRYLAQNLRKGLRPYLGCSPGAGCQRGQTNLFTAHFITCFFYKFQLTNNILHILARYYACKLFQPAGNPVIFNPAG